MTGDLFIKKGIQSIYNSEIIVLWLDFQGPIGTCQVSHEIAVQVVLKSIGPTIYNTVYVSSMFYFSKSSLLMVCELVEKSLDLEARDLGSSPSLLIY